jgi:hypothetical protein
MCSRTTVENTATNPVPMSLTSDAGTAAFANANKPQAAIAMPARVAGNGAAQQLPANACTVGCWVQVVDFTTAGVAVSTTVANIGDANVSNTRGRAVAVGDEKFFPISNTNLLYFWGATTCTIQLTVV